MEVHHSPGIWHTSNWHYKNGVLEKSSVLNCICLLIVLLCFKESASFLISRCCQSEVREIHKAS